MTSRVIHNIRKFKKLSTLKHSWNFALFTLKRSCFYAETLLRSIYTYIYLYKSTCSYTAQVVNKPLFLKKLSTQFFDWLLITNRINQFTNSKKNRPTFIK